jgi:hypothetical protein
MLWRTAEDFNGILREERRTYRCNRRLGIGYDTEVEAVRRCVGIVFDRVGWIRWKGVDGVD